MRAAQMTYVIMTPISRVLMSMKKVKQNNKCQRHLLAMQHPFYANTPIHLYRHEGRNRLGKNVLIYTYTEIEINE